MRGQSQAPVWDAKITIFAGDKNYESTESNRHGRWKLHHTLDEADFETTQNNKKRLRQDVDNPLSIRVELNGAKVEMLCPHVAVPESESDINTFVLVVLDTENVD